MVKFDNYYAHVKRDIISWLARQVDPLLFVYSVSEIIDGVYPRKKAESKASVQQTLEMLEKIGYVKSYKASDGYRWGITREGLDRWFNRKKGQKWT